MSSMPAHSGNPPVLLLVEDSPGDADLVREILDVDGGDRFEILHVQRLGGAEEALRTASVDVVLLDLSLPDGDGVANVRQLRAITSLVPIVVLTGMEDERLALACIDAGAQDYICKNEVRPVTLRRAIGYAVSRVRESQLRDLKDLLARYRGLLHEPATTSIETFVVEDELLPAEIFASLVRDYEGLLEPYLEKLVLKVAAPREAMEQIATRLGELGARPRDLLDIHVAALDRLSTQGGAMTRAVVVEARLLALEMMGLLVEFYRTHQTRRGPGGSTR
jgi:DNA-binding NarL/FixJ family response regulator